MKVQLPLSLLDYFFLIITSIFLALGSLGIYREVFLILGSTNVLAALGYKLIQNGKIIFPKLFFLYIIFLFVLLIHTFFTKADFLFFGLFLSGGLFWLEVYNFQNLFRKYLSPILIVLGILMGLLYFYSLNSPVVVPNLTSLFSASTNLLKHSDIGDLWAVILVSAFYLFSKKRSYYYVPLILAGGYFLAISYSRAALVSLAVGTIYIFQKTGDQNRSKKALIFFLSAIAVLFIYAGLSKTILFSRPYFLQALTGFIRFPLGTGIGNFSHVSNSSNYVHNLILEIFSGMGIFSVVFMFWLYKVLKSMFTSKNTNIEAAAIFLATFINFCFITTYTIPAFVWIWFIAIGCLEPEEY